MMLHRTPQGLMAQRAVRAELGSQPRDVRHRPRYLSMRLSKVIVFSMKDLANV